MTSDNECIEDAVTAVLHGTNIHTLVEDLLQEAAAPVFSAKIQNWLRQNPEYVNDAVSKLGAHSGPKTVTIQPRKFFGKSNRVKKYREQLWRKHKNEIFRESRRALASVMKHKNAIKELIDDLRKGFNSPAPKEAVRDLARTGMAERAKIYVNGNNPGKDWDTFEFETWATFIIKEAAYYAAFDRFDYEYVAQILIGVCYADYVFNKHEEDKTKYVY